MESNTHLLDAVLDTLIPASEDGRMPSAGRLELGETIRQANGAFWPSTLEGLAALDEKARQKGAAGFHALSPLDRRETLALSEESHPTLLPGLVFHTYSAYYRHPQVLEALGLEARPPFPKGFEIEEGDPSLLEPVQRRAPFYRKVE